MAYQQFTLAQMRAYAYDRLGGIAPFYRDDEINRYIRQALRMWNVLAGFWRATSVTDPGQTVANQVYYNVPSGYSYLLRVLVNGVPLSDSSLYDLDYGRATWESDVAGVGSAPAKITAWAPMSLNLFAIWPASAAGEESLAVEGVIAAPQPVTDGAFVDLGREDLEHVLDYVEHLAAFKQGGQEGEAAATFMQSFLKGAASRNALLMQSARFRSWMGLSDKKKRPMKSLDERVGAR